MVFLCNLTAGGLGASCDWQIVVELLAGRHGLGMLASILPGFLGAGRLLGVDATSVAAALAPPAKLVLEKDLLSPCQTVKVFDLGIRPAAVEPAPLDVTVPPMPGPVGAMGATFSLSSFDP